MVRRRLKVILIPALLAPLAGFLISFALPPKYTSQSLIVVEEQKVPEGYVKPVVTEDVGQRIATMQQQVLSRNRLQPMIDRLGLAKGRTVDEAVDEIRANISIEQVETDLTPPTAGGTTKKKKPGQASTVPGFYVNFTASSPKEAQDICSGLTSMLLEENLKLREAVAQNTTAFLSRQLEQAKRDIDDQDSKLAAFKKQYMGQLPGDEENNLKILMGLNSQLDANTQSPNNPQTLEQQLASLQSQLITLQARYTDDHPDVAKTKADIAEVKRKLDELNSAAAQNPQANDKASGSEPPEIRQLRLQVHQYDQIIAQATRDQQRLQEQIRAYQGRVALSPAVEEQYKLLTRDYDTAQRFYNDLLAKKSQSAMQTDMERGQQGEQMRLLNPANLPDAPSFPNRWLFTGGGLGAGLAIGLALALWMELRDKSIRTEQDVLAAMELPMLVSLPWENPDSAARNGNGRFRIRSKTSDEKERTVEV